jgi:hypothetical protein
MSEIGPETNGATAPAEDELAEFLPKLKGSIERLQDRRAVLAEQLAAIEGEIRRRERAFNVLADEAPTRGRPKRAKSQPAKDPREGGTRLSADRLQAIEDIVHELAAQKEEFRQRDVRERIDATSSVMSGAFEVLRQRGVIRLARVDGNNKWFRLTRDALVRAESE